MKSNLLYIVLIFLISCGTTGNISKTEVEENPRPDWAYNRPINSSYYIGIGSSNKISFPTDYSVVAKKNALSDMSSEITVKVSGESFYHTIDRNKEYSEEFQSMIRSNFSEEISDYEIVDTWENESEFWIFTRISKVQHAQIKAEKKSKVLNESHDNYLRALDFSTMGKPADALDLLNSALFNMEAYWAESNPYVSESGTIQLDNSIYNEIRNICSSLELKTNADVIKLNYINGYANSLSVAIHKDDLYLSGIPINYKFSNTPYTRAKTLYTNSDGLVTIHAENFGSEQKSFQLNIWVDFEELLKSEHSNQMTEMLLASINQNKVSIPVSLEMPSVFFRPNEDNVLALSEVLKNELQKNGFNIVTDPSKCDLELSLTISSRNGGQTQGFQVAFLDFSVLLEDHTSHRQLFADSYANIKGIHMNLTGAQGDAIKNGAKKIRKEIVPKMIQIIL